MSTPITASPAVADTFIAQILAVAAVLTAFPVTTLSGAAANRFKTALAVLTATPANRQIVDENGDILVCSFATSSPNQFVFTQKGIQRLELEVSRSQGY